MNEYSTERELRRLWLSRVMFNPLVGWPPETRSFEEFCLAVSSQECASQEDKQR